MRPRSASRRARGAARGARPWRGGRADHKAGGAVGPRREAGAAQQARERVRRPELAGDGRGLHGVQRVEGKEHLDPRQLGEGEERLRGGLGRQVEVHRALRRPGRQRGGAREGEQQAEQGRRAAHGGSGKVQRAARGPMAMAPDESSVMRTGSAVSSAAVKARKSSSLCRPPTPSAATAGATSIRRPW